VKKIMIIHVFQLVAKETIA